VSDNERLFAEISESLKKGLKVGLLSMERMPAGGNNRVYKLHCDDKKNFIAKVYYKNPKDSRDRLDSEFRSSKFLWENHIRNVPEPFLADRPGYFGIYEFVDGVSIEARLATNAQIEEAARFLIQLKDLSLLPAALSLPPASEACYSYSKVAQNILARLARFDNYASRDPQDEEMIQFLRKEFEPLLKEIHESRISDLKREGVDPDGDLDVSKRTLSPSDFGFHNALLKSSGRLTFVDLEYFGWDDPVKMISDFLLHPGMNLDENQRKHFAKFILPKFSNDPDFRARFRAGLPLFGLKWCLILLNEFLTDQMGRRRFAKGAISVGQEERASIEADHVITKKLQLNKSRQMLNRIDNERKNFPYSFS